ncbi:MAG TPA: dihydroorotate dehydrogenase [Rectinemataceae bacterium]|nr:dihydroorotate dehydrogenase [Rectinemataceae bacterium]
MKPDLRVRLGSLELPNPVGVASGTFGYGAEYEELVDVDALGALYTKAVTPEPRPGNEVPRIVETPSGMLNSIGLANPGLEAFVAEKLPALRARRCPVIVNVAGSTEDDYRRVIERIEAEGGVSGYEINVSCPNVRHGGLSFGTDPAQVERLTSSLRSATKRCLIVKLTPNVTDIAAMAKAAEAGGADALSCINTLVGMAIDVKRRRPRLAAGTGGLSGPAIRPVGVASVYRVSRAVSIPVIGLGGIMCANDALEYLLAGARAVQVGTGTFVDPSCAERVLEGIRAWMETEGVERVEDIAGLLRS